MSRIGRTIAACRSQIRRFQRRTVSRGNSPPVVCLEFLVRSAHTSVEAPVRWPVPHFAVRRLNISEISKKASAEVSYSYMKRQFLLLGCFIAATFATTAFALTVNQQVTLAYVREHPKEWSVKVAKGKDNLLDFTIKHDVATRMYHVAHLEVYHNGKLIATSDTPSYGKKQGNTFHFSISAESIAESKFDLSDSSLAGSGEDAVPIPGTIIHQFRLLDFVPEQVLKSALGK